MKHDDYSLVPRQRGLGTRLDDMSYQLAIDYISLVPRPDLGTRIRGHTIDRGVRHERNLVHCLQKSKLKARNPS